MALLHAKSLLRLLIFVSCLCTSLVHIGPIAVQAQGPLFTDSRWIVDGAGQRVKLACVNWPSHLQPVLAEGLSKQAAVVIMQKIKLMGFNCVRFTWPLELATNDSLAYRTVSKSFEILGLGQALGGITASNPWAPHLTLIEAFKAMLWRFQQNNLMVILDNHLTVPGWCCSRKDRNGWFGDQFFDPNQWVSGLSKMATLATQFPNVIGMSLRNELRGPRSNVNDWYKYMQQGAEAVHSANPNVLVILSGLDFDKDLSFLDSRSVQVSFTRKLVFEVHWYSFSNSGWTAGNLNDVCGRKGGNVMNQAGFIAHNNLGPLILSEFGVDGRGTNEEDNRYLSCLMAMAAAEDWDFAVWALQGSYYLREGNVDLEEVYGLLDYSWNNIRNPTLLNRLSSLQISFRGPGLQQTDHHMILLHPQTGYCVTKGPQAWSLQLGSCTLAQAWMHRPDKTLQAKGTNSFLRADGAQKAAIVATNGASQWEMVSNSRLHLSTKARDGSKVCLDVDGKGRFLFTNACKCLQSDKSCDPTSQWFRLVESITV